MKIIRFYCLRLVVYKLVVGFGLVHTIMAIQVIIKFQLKSKLCFQVGNILV